MDLFAWHCSSNTIWVNISEDGIGGSCSTHDGGQKCMKGLVGKIEGKTVLEDLGVD